VIYPTIKLILFTFLWYNIKGLTITCSLNLSKSIPNKKPYHSACWWEVTGIDYHIIKSSCYIN
jgi:hypothetical protein